MVLGVCELEDWLGDEDWLAVADHVWWGHPSPASEAVAPAPGPLRSDLDELLDVDLELYLRDESAPPPGYACPEPGCGHRASKRCQARAHARRHAGDKPYACAWPACSWRFSRSDELARHARSHSGFKPYACPLCPKRFSRSDHLAKHARVHERRRAAAAGARTPAAPRRRVVDTARRPKRQPTVQSQ